MKTTRFRTAAFLALVTLLVFTAIGAASACERRGGHWDEGVQLAKAHLRLAADAHHVVPGGVVTLTGTLTAEPTETVDADDGEGAAQASSAGLACLTGGHRGHGREATPTPVAGVEVAIFQRTGKGAWSQVDTATTDAFGAFSAIETINSDVTFKAVFAGNDLYAAARSSKVRVRAVADVTPPLLLGMSAHANKNFHVRGKATQGAGKVTVTVFKRSGGKWTAKVTSVRASVSAASVYTAQLKLRAGAYQIVASQAGSSRVLGASSAHRALKVAARR